MYSLSFEFVIRPGTETKENGVLDYPDSDLNSYRLQQLTHAGGP